MTQNAVFDRLYGLAQEGKSVENGEVIIIREPPGGEHGYLQGSPLWTTFGERAYVFANEEDAQKLMDEFPDTFAHCRIHRRVP